MEASDDHEDHKNQDTELQNTTDTKPDNNEQEASDASSGVVMPAVHGKHIKKSKKKLILAVSAVVVLALGVGAYFFMNKESTPVAETSTQTTPKLGVAVTLIDGTAKFSTDGQTWNGLTTETSLVEGDWVSTDAASRVILTLDDGSVIRLDESSSLSLTDLSADNVVVTNESGDVYTRVVTSERTFIVMVDEVGYTAQGTAYLTVNETTSKGVQVLQSSVKVVSSEETTVTEGKQFYKTHDNAELKDKVTDISVDGLKSSSFMVWNLEQDKQSEAFKDKLGYLAKIEEAPAPAPTPAPATASIKLSGSTVENGVKLNWSVSNIGSVEGFKVVRSKKTTSPTYGKDEANYASGSSARTLTWKDGSGITYHYRVCGYVNKTCTVYSNSVTLASPYLPPTPVTDGTMTLDITGTVASWTFTGVAPHGYKLVVGNNGSTPSYFDNILKKGASSSPLDFNGSGLSAGTYSVRVCAYTNDSNGCSNYSDTETLVIP